MKTRLVPLAVIAALLAFGAIGAACDGGGEALTIEEYFQELDGLKGAFDERFGAIFEFDEADFESLALEEQVEFVRELFDAFPPVIEDFIDGAKDLDPPTEVTDLHNDVVRAGDEGLEALQDVAGQIDDVQSKAELDALFVEGGPLEAAVERFDQACFALQDIADENQIEIDLNCENE